MFAIERSRPEARRVLFHQRMRYQTFLTILASSSLAAACGNDADVDDTPLLGDCSDDEPGDDVDNCGPDDGGDGGDGDGGGGDGTDVAVTGDLTLALVGTGIFLGVDELCLDLSGNFSASYDGVVRFEDNSWTISAVDDLSLQVEDDCQCSNAGVQVDAMASITATVRIDANAESCDLACDAHASAKADAECSGSDDEASCRASVMADAKLACSASCEAAVSINGHAAVDASVDIDLDVGDDDELEGQGLDLQYDSMVDADGNVIELL